MIRMPVRCPACDDRLLAVRLRCGRCGTAIEGEFDLGLGALGADDASFARAFLLARGNLRELERTFGLSYAALRGRLDALVGHLEGEIAEALTDGEHAPARPGAALEDIGGVLDRLEGGEIDAAEAARRLRGIAAQQR